MNILILLKVNAQEKSNNVTPVNAPDWWYELDDQEKWEYFRDMSTLYIQLLDVVKEEHENNEELLIQLKKNNDFLKKYKPFCPKFSVYTGGAILLNKNNLNELEVNTLLNLGFNIYFFQGRFYLSPSLYIEPYENLGGGIGFNFGIVF